MTTMDGFDGGECSVGVDGVLLEVDDDDDEDIAGIVTVFLPIVVVVVWLSFILLRNVLLEHKKAGSYWMENTAQGYVFIHEKKTIEIIQANDWKM